MKRFIVMSLAVFAMMFVLATAGLAASGVGVVNLAFIMDESKAGQQANAALAGFIEERQDALQQMQAYLEQLNHDLEADESDLSDDERLGKQRELDEGVQEYMSAANTFEAEVQNALQVLRQRILSEIGAVLQIVGDEGGFDLIVDTTSVYYYRHVIDLTNEVIRRYDLMWEAAQEQSEEP